MHSVTAVNNIFVSGAGATSICYTGELDDLRSNVFIGCTTALFANHDSGDGGLTSIDDVNKPSAFVDRTPTQASGNLTFASLSDLDMVGPTDFHLTAATPAHVRFGGINAATNTCGTGSSSSCGDVETDRDLAPRTCPAAGQCFSIGPYELDTPARLCPLVSLMTANRVRPGARRTERRYDCVRGQRQGLPIALALPSRCPDMRIHRRSRHHPACLA